jgi:hypothetical protein
MNNETLCLALYVVTESIRAGEPLDKLRHGSKSLLKGINLYKHRLRAKDVQSVMDAIRPLMQEIPILDEQS